MTLQLVSQNGRKKQERRRKSCNKEMLSMRKTSSKSKGRTDLLMKDLLMARTSHMAKEKKQEMTESTSTRATGFMERKKERVLKKTPSRAKNTAGSSRSQSDKEKEN